jgi:hypothetical protein
MRSNLANVFTLVASALVLGVNMGANASYSAEEDPLHEAVIRAFEADPAILQAKAELESTGHIGGTVQTISLGGGCGFAGCDHGYLLSQVFWKEGGQPRSIPLLAEVVVRAPGFSVVRVQLVTLIPVVSLETPSTPKR